MNNQVFSTQRVIPNQMNYQVHQNRFMSANDYSSAQSNFSPNHYRSNGRPLTPVDYTPNSSQILYRSNNGSNIGSPKMHQQHQTILTRPLVKSIDTVQSNNVQKNDQFSNMTELRMENKILQQENLRQKKQIDETFAQLQVMTPYQQEYNFLQQKYVILYQQYQTCEGHYNACLNENHLLKKENESLKHSINSKQNFQYEDQYNQKINVMINENSRLHQVITQLENQILMISKQDHQISNQFQQQQHTPSPQAQKHQVVNDETEDHHQTLIRQLKQMCNPNIEQREIVKSPSKPKKMKSVQYNEEKNVSQLQYANQSPQLNSYMPQLVHNDQELQNKIQELKANLEEAQEELEDVKEELITVESKYERCKKELEIAKKSSNNNEEPKKKMSIMQQRGSMYFGGDANQKNMEMVLQIKDLKEQIRELKKLEQVIDKKDQQITTLNQDIQNLDSQVSFNLQQKNNLMTEMTQIKSTQDIYIKQNEALKQSIENKGSESDVVKELLNGSKILNQKIVYAQDQTTQLKEAYDKLHQESESRLNNQKIELDAQIFKLQDNNTQLINDTKKLQKKIDDLEYDNQDYVKEITSLRSKQQQMKGGNSDDEDVNTREIDLEAKTAEQKNQIVSLKQDLDRLSSQIETQKQLNSDLKKELSQIHDKNQTQLDKQITEIKNLKKENQKYENTIDDYKNQLEMVSQNKDSKQYIDMIKQKDKEISDLYETCNQRQTEIDKINLELQNLKSGENDREKMKHLELIEMLNEDLETVRNDKEELQQTIVDLEEQIENINDVVQAKSIESLDYQQINEKLKKDLENMSQELLKNSKKVEEPPKKKGGWFSRGK